MAKASARCRIEAVFADNGQLFVHRIAAARRFLDDDAVGGSQCSNAVEQPRIGHRARRHGGPFDHVLGRCANGDMIGKFGHQHRRVCNNASAAGQCRAMLGIITDKEQRRAFGPVRAVTFDMISEGGRTGDKDQVMPRQCFNDGLAAREQEPGKLRMILRKNLARRKRRDPNRRTAAFSQRNCGIPAASPRDACAEHKHRAFGAVKGFGDPVHSPERHRFSCNQRRNIGHRTFDIPIVDGDRNKRRPARWRHRHQKSVDDGGGDILCPCRFAGPFDIGPGQFGRAI